jgi:hypothetical protein
MSCGNPFRIATNKRLEDRVSIIGRGINFCLAKVWTIGVLGLDSREGLGIFLFAALSRPALVPTQPLIQWVPGAVSLGIKRPGRVADQLPPSSAEVENTWSYTSTPPIRLHGAVLS